ncbi:set1/Ash2 histone methyltransferase complex subunit ASH2-like [Diadema setosum]|uniref:set1/Ash2 histone methyltransferase complex subunit ASH2-like n=1 Tax=Diadema setosum TaxID=31175 RepID=UPI003B3B94B7
MAENKDSESGSLKDDRPEGAKASSDGEKAEERKEESQVEQKEEKEVEKAAEKTDEVDTDQQNKARVETTLSSQPSDDPEPMEVTENLTEEIQVQESVEMSVMEQATGKGEEEEEKEREEEVREEEPAVEEEVLMEVENKENISEAVMAMESGDTSQGEESIEMTGGDHCYCGKGRAFEDVELQCTQCAKWFHKACITTVSVVNSLPYMTTYTFTCKNCTANKIETFSRKVANFRELCHCALANLLAKHKNDDPPKVLFSKEADLIPFIDTHWEQLTPMPRRTTVTWHGTIVKAMMKEDDVFICKEKPDDPSQSETEYPLFGLVDQDLSKISPISEVKLGSSLKLDSSQKLSSSLSSVNGNSNLSASNRISRSAKRKGLESSQGLTSSKRTRSEVPASQKLPPHGYPLEHPFNKDGYRYILTEPDPHAPSSAFEEDQWIGKPIPAHLYRMALSKDVLLALHDRAPQLKISEDRLSVTGDRGYCMVRSTHGVNRGSWYFEVTIDQMPEGSATRLGWSQPLGNLQAPLGYDKFSYSWRSRKGTRFHESRGKHYSEAYGAGDTLGFYIQLPDKTAIEQIIPPTYKDRALIKFKSHLYFEEKDQTSEAEKALKSTQNSKIIFFKNGENKGVAFENLYEGTYHPAISLYKQCSASINFGPDFKFPPKGISDFRPISDLAYLSAVEQTISDILFLVEHEKDYEMAARGILIDI